MAINKTAAGTFVVDFSRSEREADPENLPNIQTGI
jgi:hypothetical protein